MEAPQSLSLSYIPGVQDEYADSDEEKFEGDKYVPPEARLPSISPRDRLSYQDDKKFCKEMSKFVVNNQDLYKMIEIMELEILKNKPGDIVKFLAEDFFTERRQMQMRKTISQHKILV